MFDELKEAKYLRTEIKYFKYFKQNIQKQLWGSSFKQSFHNYTTFTQ